MRLIVELYANLKLLQDSNWDVKMKCDTQYIDLGGMTDSIFATKDDSAFSSVG